MKTSLTENGFSVRSSIEGVDISFAGKRRPTPLMTAQEARLLAKMLVLAAGNNERERRKNGSVRAPSTPNH